MMLGTRNPQRFTRPVDRRWLMGDPFERADHMANNYETWWIRRVFTLVPAQTFVKEYIDTFKEFPPRQKPAKFNVDDALKMLQSPGGN
jgi:hypothetical protein